MLKPRFTGMEGAPRCGSHDPKGAQGQRHAPRVAHIVRSAPGLALNLHRMAEGAKGALDADSS